MKQLIIGIECTAWFFGISIVNKEGSLIFERKNIVSPTKGLFEAETISLHKSFLNKYKTEIFDFLDFHNSSLKEIIFTNGPGFNLCLQLGSQFSNEISNKYKIKIYGIHHIFAHLSAVQYILNKKVKKNHLILYFSGGHTHWLLYNKNKFKVLFQSSDLALGNFFDKVGRNLGLAHPGGPKIELLYLEHKQKFPEYISEIHKGLEKNFNLNGLLTYYSNSKKNLGEISRDLLDTICLKVNKITQKFLYNYSIKEIWCIGGVAQNSILKESLNNLNKDNQDRTINKILFKNLNMIKNPLNSDNSITVALCSIYHRGALEKNPIVNHKKLLDSIEIITKTSFPSESKIKRNGAIIKKTYFLTKLESKKNIITKMLNEKKMLEKLEKNLYFKVPKIINSNLRLLFLELEFLQGYTSLLNCFKNTNLNKSKIIEKAIQAIAMIHKEGIVHNDLNLDNLLYNQDLEKIAIIDFTKSFFYKKDAEPLMEIINFKQILNFEFSLYLKYFEGNHNKLDILIKMKKKYFSE